MSGYNKCIFAGRLGSDAELKVLDSGNSMCKFSVAVSESWKDKSGVKQERTEWIRATLWGKRAEALAKYLTKGTQVVIEGKLKTDVQERDGVKVYYTGIQVDDVVLMGGGAKAGEGGATPAKAKGEDPFASNDGGDEGADDFGF